MEWVAISFCGILFETVTFSSLKKKKTLSYLKYSRYLTILLSKVVGSKPAVSYVCWPTQDGLFPRVFYNFGL